MILVDSNVFIDVVRADSIWMPWSLTHLARARSKGIAINPIIYAELLGHVDLATRVDALLRDASCSFAPLSQEATRVAVRTYWRYRARRGAKTGVLPDFFIGAQAVTQGWTLLTREATRYRAYFPTLELIAPN